MMRQPWADLLAKLNELFDAAYPAPTLESIDVRRFIRQLQEREEARRRFLAPWVRKAAIYGFDTTIVVELPGRDEP